MSFRRLIVVSLLMVCCGAKCAVADQRDEIQQWVNDLNCDSYQQRDQATKRLAAAGRLAIDAVAQAAISGQPEVSWRAVSILEQIGLTGDQSTLVAVVEAMETIGKSGKTSIVRSRNGLMKKWRDVRHQRAAAELRQLGAKISDTSNRWAFAGGGFGGGAIVFDALEPVLPEDVELEVAHEHDLHEHEHDHHEHDAELATAPVDSRIRPVEEPKKIAATSDAAASLGETDKSDQPEEVQGDAKIEVFKIPITDPIVVVEDEPAPAIRPLEIRDFEPGPVTEETEAGEEGPVARVVADDAIAEDRVFAVHDFVMPPPMLMGLDLFVATGDENEQTAQIVTLGPSWKGTDDDLRLLADLDGTTNLALIRFKLTDQAVKQIARLSRLRRLTITHSEFNRDSVLSLKQRRPSLTIYATGPTILGVSGETDERGFRVSNVVPGSGADKAGIQNGDIITSADNVSFKSLDQLTLIIAKKKIGDRLSLKMLRNGKTLVKVATLGSRS